MQAFLLHAFATGVKADKHLRQD